MVYGEVNLDLIKELERSVVGESKDPEDILEMETFLKDFVLQVEKVRVMGAYKTLITFSTKEDMLEVVKQGDHFLATTLMKFEYGQRKKYAKPNKFGLNVLAFQSMLGLRTI